MEEFKSGRDERTKKGGERKYESGRKGTRKKEKIM